MNSLGARLRNAWPGLLLSVGAVLLATLIAAGIIALLGRNPVAVISTMINGPIGNAHRFADALTQACPLMLCGLAVAVAFRCQAWNIGVEGQYLAGAMVAAAIGIHAGSLPAGLLVPLLLIASALAGAAFAMPAILLELRRHVPLVLSTILLNFIALYLLRYLTQGPLQGADGTAPESDPIVAAAKLSPLLARTNLHAGFVLAVLLAVATAVMLSRTTFGFSIRAAGLNPVAARWTGTPVDRVRLGVMALSGGLGGLAGGLQVAGVHHLLRIDAAEGFGYVGIAVALLGRLHPLGVAVATIFIGMLDVGALHVQQRAALGVPADISEVIKGVLVLAVLVLSGPRLRNWFATRRELRHVD